MLCAVGRILCQVVRLGLPLLFRAVRVEAIVHRKQYDAHDRDQRQPEQRAGVPSDYMNRNIL